MLRKSFLAAALILTLAVTGCAGKPAATTPIDAPKTPEPAPVTATNPPAPNTPTGSTNPTTPTAPATPTDKSPVSSEITVPEEPWVSAPAAVTVLTRQVKITFSGPVDKASVEAELAKSTVQFPNATPEWNGDQEVMLNFTSGCAYYKISAAGAKDAQGKELDPALNPLLDLHMPCHGDGGGVITLPGKYHPDIPIGSVIHDIDPQSGWLLARNGNIYFLIASDSKTKKPVARTESGLWSTFLPGGNIILGDGNSLKVVTQHGEVQRTIPLQQQPINGIISPDGKLALILLAKGVIRLDLTTWEVTTINEIASFNRDDRLNWNGDRVLIVPWGDKAHATIDVMRGEVYFPTSKPQIYSPNGQLVIDAEAGAIVNPNGERIFTLTDALEAGNYPYAIWAPDNRHVFFPGGQVIDITTGEEVTHFTYEFEECKPIPQRLGQAGDQLVAAYLVPCH